MYLVHLTTLLVFPVHQNHSKVQEVLHQNSCRMLALYSSAQRKPNGESERERVQNGYSMDIEWIRNGNGSQKRKKAFSRTQTIRERVLQNAC